MRGGGCSGTFRKVLESCKIRLVYGQLTLVDPVLCSGVTLECGLSTDDLLDEHLGLNDDVTLLFSPDTL